MNGIVVLDKPAGMTSHDAVAIARRSLGVKRIGHAGTLDPDATGVLVLGVGRATRLLQFLEAHEKSYQATIKLGVETNTLDAAGEVTATADASHVTKEDLEAALEKFVGQIDQVPPMVSAIKVDGEALYKKARRGEEVERASRRVTVYEARVEGFEPPTVYVRCSKGTYIRTLVADVGRALGVGAHVATLRRLGSGPFTTNDAIPIERLSPDGVIPIERAVDGLPRRDLSGPSALALVQGKTISAGGIEGPYAVFAPSGLIAVARDENNGTRPICVLVDAANPAEALS